MQSQNKYTKACKKVFGEDANDKILAEVAKDVYISSGGMIPNCDLPSDDGERTLFYDSFSDRYFTSTIEAVKNAEYHINRNFILKGYVSLNEFYDFLGIEQTPSGAWLEWNGCCDNDYDDISYQWLDFDHTLTVLEDGLECYIISFAFNPIPVDYH